MTGVLIADRRGEDAHRAEGHVKTQAEVRAMQPQAREGPEPREAGRDDRVLSPGAFGGSTALLPSRTHLPVQRWVSNVLVRLGRVLQIL